MQLPTINNPSASLSPLSALSLSLSRTSKPSRIRSQFRIFARTLFLYLKEINEFIADQRSDSGDLIENRIVAKLESRSFGELFHLRSLILKGFWWFSSFRKTHERVGQAGYFFEFQPFCHQNYHLFAVPLVIKIIQAFIKIKINRFFE